MIAIVIVLLVLILAALWIDWPKILNGRSFGSIDGFQKARSLLGGALARKPKAPKEPKPLKPAKKPENKQSEPDIFQFEVTDQEHAQMDRIVVEEEPSPYESNQEVANLLAEADVCFRKGEMKAAEQYYLQAAAKDPRCSKAYSRLGVIYLENGESWDDAEQSFRQALKYDAQNGFILNNLGLVLYHQDRYADAIRHFEQAVRQDELNAARHANLGMAYMAMRQYAKAESSFKKSLKLAPNEMEYKDLLNESIEKKNAHKTMIRR